MSSKTRFLFDTKINPSIRRIPQSEIVLEDGEQPIGEGRFGVCYKARFCHFEVVVKRLKNGTSAEPLLIYEANMMITCTTKYTPYLFGINLPQTSLIMSSHGSSGTLSAVLERHDDDHTATSWIQLVLHIAEGVHAIHSKKVIHNDLKPDNILLDRRDGSYFPIIADFGKACLRKDGQKHVIPAEKQEGYMKQHAHLAPDLIKGITSQDTSTDVCSLGYMIGCVEKRMVVDQLSLIKCSTTHPNRRDRPSIETIISKLRETLYPV